MSFGERKGIVKKILIADDVEFNRDVLGEIFGEQYEILEAADGEEAIACIQENFEKLSLIFLDLIMPKQSGFDVLEYMKKYGYLELVPVIIITGEATYDTDVAAYEYGVADVIYKPFSRQVITRRALNIIELYEQRRNLALKLDETETELRQSRKKLEANTEFLINAFSSVVEFRSSMKAGLHIDKVRPMAKVLFHTWAALHKEFDYNEVDIALMVNAAALHDIGKLSIPDEILLKRGKLTPEEFKIMKTHTIRGCEILECFKQEMDDKDFYRYCYDICRYHHERYDGKGYPDRLKGDEIPVWAQIVSIAEVFDALVDSRCYRAPYAVDEAIRMIKTGECGTFSPELLECFEAAKFQLIAIAENDAR